MGKPEGHVCHVISNTHWDREWRYSRERIRFLLVDMVDRLLEILERDPTYRAFHLDAQAIPLDDYLEIRSENEGRLRRLVREGRILVGPWLVLPDEFLVSGESLVRNLLWGHRIASRFGPVMKVGYSPFSWGQISQLPQLYAGFGIDAILFYRGVNAVEAPKAEFWWEGADGTRALTSRFSTLPRYNFWYMVFRPVVHGLATIRDRILRWEGLGAPFHGCDALLRRLDYQLAEPEDRYDRDRLEGCLEALRDAQKGDFATPHLFWAQGHDSSSPHARIPEIIRDANRLLPDDEVRHGTIPEYAAALKEAVAELERGGEGLPVLRGEMRSPQIDERSTVLYGQVTSARMDIKLANFRSEILLAGQAEPAAAAAWLLGAPYPRAFLDRAWRWLLENHGHDSIGGCSVDPVHDDMRYRFRQCDEIATCVLERALQRIGAAIDPRDSGRVEVLVVAFNPTPIPRDEVVPLWIDVPAGRPVADLALVDPEGREAAKQVVGSDPALPVLQQPTDSPNHVEVTRVELRAHLEGIPPLGYKAYRLRARPGIRRDLGSLAAGPARIENEHLAVEAAPNGTLTLIDKATGRVWRDLGLFEDRGEVGDPWVSRGPRHDRVCTSLGAAARVALLEDGPVLARLGIEIDLALPRAARADRSARLAELRRVPIRSVVTLCRGARRVEIETTVENRVEDHRLRVLFPTDVRTDEVFAETPFDVVRRPIPRPDYAAWREPPQFANPLHRFVDLADARGGLALLVAGLKEYEALDDPRRTVALTLLRCFRAALCVSHTMVEYPEMRGSQCPGTHAFRYALYPHARDWEAGGVPAEAARFTQDLRVFQIGPSRSGRLPLELALIEIDPPRLALSAIKQAEDGEGLVLRLFNPGASAKRVRVRLAAEIERARRVTLEEAPIEDLPVAGGREVEIAAGPKRIVTLAFRFRPIAARG